MKLPIFALCLSLAATALPQAALAAPKVSAADDAKARTLYKQGDKAYAEGNYEAALDAFQQAYELSHRELLLYNIGNTYERLGKPKEAADALEQYLPHAKKAEKDTIEKRIDNLKKRAEEEAEAEKKRLAEEAAAKKAAEEEKQKEVPAPEPTKPEPERDKTLPYVLIGVGVVGVGAGTFFGLKALSARSDAESGCDGSLCSDAAKDALDRDKTYSLLTDVSLGIGLVSAGVGTYLLLSGDNREKPTEARFDVRGGVSRQGGEVRIVGSF